MDKNTSIPQDYSQDDLVELLRQYYKRLFPCKLYHRWLAYGGVSKNYFGNREFSFTLKDDVYIRYLSFADVSEFEKELIKRIPYKIDIGAVYNYKPKDHKTLQAGTFKPMEKELVFDIDMTDYDEVRTCCSGASICRKCWMFMTAALKILDAALEEDFGFKYRLWVYSGRRGIHCWVADSAARKLTQAGRSAVVEYLSVIKGSDSQVKKVYFKGSNLHPSLARANKIVKEFFCKYYLTEQNILDKEEQEKIMLKLIPDETTRQKVEKAWKDGNFSTKEKWDILENNVNAKMTLKHVLEEIMFQYVYPRLDINVSKGLNHLLKSPFCVHPKTGGEVYHYHTKLVLKQPRGGGAFNWHQDYGYWYKNGCLSPDLATLWLPLDKINSKNGCLKIIPGSHKLGRIDHININNQVTADPERVFHILNKYGFLYVEMEPGDGLFFHSNVLHSSDQNWSEDRRWAVISSYNLRANDPVYKHHHPNYYYLQKIKNSEIASFHGKFATDYKFMVDSQDKSLREGYGQEDRVK